MIRISKYFQISNCFWIFKTLYCWTAVRNIRYPNTASASLSYYGLERKLAPRSEYQIHHSWLLILAQPVIYLEENMFHLNDYDTVR